MQNSIFNRYERKYIITKQQKDEMIAFLKNHLVFDTYSKDDKGYTIYNIYYDTHDYSVIRNSILKPTYKDKLRLRSYTFPIKPNDLVFLEIKKKYEGRINKRRIELTYLDATNYLVRNIKPHLTTYIDNQIFNEIDYFIKVHQAKPGAFIKYHRVALMKPNAELRVTFDENIIFRNQQIDFSSDIGNPILENDDLCLMEVKSEDNFPFWLARRLSEYELYSQSFSKYGRAYKQYLLGGTIDDYILYHY